MFPKLFTIFGVTLHTFGALVATGFLAGMWWCRREAERLKYPVDKVMDLTFWLMISGLIGARVMFIAVNWDLYSQHPFEILAVWKGGLVWYGGLIGAFAAGVVLMRRWGLPVWGTSDLVAPGVMYGLAFGRLGCLAAGDDHGRLVESALRPEAVKLLDQGLLYGANGRLTTLAIDTIHREGFDAPWWSLIFDGRGLVQDDLIGLPLYPTQLMMSGKDMLIFALLIMLRKYRKFDGQIVSAMLMMYAIARYVVELFRGDLGRGFWIQGVSTSMGVSLAIFSFGLALYLVQRARNQQLGPRDAAAQA